MRKRRNDEPIGKSGGAERCPIRFSFSFEVVIAYVIPGFITLNALKATNTDLASLLKDTYGQDSVGRWTILIALSLVTGMIVSIVRASLLDNSFRISLRIWRWMPEQYGRIQPVEPDYGKLSVASNLAVFQEIQSGLRPALIRGNRRRLRQAAT